MPTRIQLKRTKGWRKPEGAVVVTRATKWGNPFKIGPDGTREDCVEKYRRWLPHSGLDPMELRGKDLCCFCALDKPCHADVLLAAANRDAEAHSPRRRCP